MNKIIFTSLIFAGNLIIFSACNNNAKVETKQASITTTTSGTTAGTNTTEGTTSGSDEASTSGHMQEGMGSDLMKSMQSTMNEMKQMKMTGDPDYDFASMMIKHHEGGMKLAEEEISKGQSQELVDLAMTIKADQEKEKKELKALTSTMKPSGKNQTFIDEMNKQMKMAESEMSKITMKGNIDEDFATMMAMHYKHGVNMSKAELKYGNDQKLKSMVQKSMDKQKKQIQQLEAIEIASKE